MSNELLVLKELSNLGVPAEYEGMLTEVSNSWESIEETKKAFFKSHSQFMDSSLVLTHQTTHRNIQQVLSEIERIESALEEAYFKYEETLVDIDSLKYDISQEKDVFLIKKLRLTIIKKEKELVRGKNYVLAAIRRLANFTEQYQELTNGDTLTEAEFEAQEEEYHIKKAFDQATTSARSRGGLVDEGNFGYLNQLGINCGLAQRLITQYLNHELSLMDNGEEPTFTLYQQFLQDMYQKFKGCSDKAAEFHGKRVGISKVATLGYDQEKTRT
jgi:hypothetical protein